MGARQVDVDVTDDDRRRLEGLVEASEVDRLLDVILAAGAAEALGYATGSAVFSSMTELRMYRVFCLLQAGMKFEESESLVATLFKLTPSGARRVVASTLARYAYELRDGVDKEVRNRLESGSWVPGDKRWAVRLPPGFVRDRALGLCRESDEPNPEAKRGAVWYFPHETFNWLRDKVGLVPIEKP